MNTYSTLDFVQSCSPLKPFHKTLKGFHLKGLGMQRVVPNMIKLAGKITAHQPIDVDSKPVRSFDRMIQGLERHQESVALTLLGGLGHVALMKRFHRRPNTRPVRCVLLARKVCSFRNVVRSPTYRSFPQRSWTQREQGIAWQGASCGH